MTLLLFCLWWKNALFCFMLFFNLSYFNASHVFVVSSVQAVQVALIDCKGSGQDNRVKINKDCNLKPVYYEKDTLALKPEFWVVLSANIICIRLTQKTVVIESHTDDTKSDEYSLSLSARVANRIMQIIYDQGVNLPTIYYIPYGKDKPVCHKKTEACRALNRRVEFKFKD